MLGIFAGAVAASLTLAVVSAVAWRTVRRRQVAAELAMDTPNGIVEDGFVRIGGIDQWIGIRGDDRNHPVLLVLHGGPGMSYAVFTPVIRAWEHHFTVVQWDRRGVGKTLGRNGRDGSGEMTFARCVDDAIEVAEHLRARFRQDRIVLLAGSAGTVVGLLLVQRRPDLFSAYVGTDQNVDAPRSEAESYALTLARLKDAGRRRDGAALEAMGPDPGRWDFHQWNRKQRLTMQTDPVLGGIDRTLLLPLMLTSPTHSLRDVWDLVVGLDFAGARLFRELLAWDARQHATRFEVPLFVFQGDSDIFTPASLAEAWLQEIEAPTKQFASIPGAGHFAAFTHPEAFLNELVTRVLPVATLRHGAARAASTSADHIAGCGSAGSASGWYCRPTTHRRSGA